MINGNSERSNWHVIARKPARDEGFEIVLRHNTEDKITPYITHVYDKERNYYFWGHYHDDIEFAAQDYKERS